MILEKLLNLQWGKVFIIRILVTGNEDIEKEGRPTRFYWISKEMGKKMTLLNK